MSFLGQRQNVRPILANHLGVYLPHLPLHINLPRHSLPTLQAPGTEIHPLLTTLSHDPRVYWKEKRIHP